MSRDMVSFDSFLDVGLFDPAAPADPSTRQRVHQLNEHGAVVPIESYQRAPLGQRAQNMAGAIQGWTRGESDSRGNRIFRHTIH
jgi:hypothetical protein